VKIAVRGQPFAEKKVDSDGRELSCPGIVLVQSGYILYAIGISSVWWDCTTRETPWL